MKFKIGVLAGWLAASALIMGVLPNRHTTLPPMQKVRLTDNVTPSLVQNTKEQIHQAIPEEVSAEEAPVVEPPVEETTEAPVEETTEIPVEGTAAEEVTATEAPTEETTAATIPVVETPAEETQASETQSWETQAWETQSWETQSWETQSWETQSWETQSWETQSWETQAWETQSWETQSWETQSWETQAWETQSWETQAWETQSWETQSWETQSWETQSWETQAWETTAEETTVEEATAEEATTEEATVEEATVEETVAEETVVEETTAEETTVEETEKTTAEETTEEAATEEATEEETVEETTEETVPEETRVIYEIPEDALYAPMPNKAFYGETDDPEVLRDLIARAEPLLDGQTLYFHPEIERMENSVVHYYLDDSILAIVWKNVVDSSALTFAEVKVAHPSQFRRYLSGGEFGSVLRFLTSEMAVQVNAVVATSADFYGYRNAGVVVVDGVAEKMNPGLSDTCYINDQGDLIIEQDQPFTTLEELQEYVDENNIQFSLSFGPGLVKDGVPLELPRYYPVGEIDQQFSRAGICQLGKLHYLSVTANFEGRYWAVMTLQQFADVLVQTGCTQAYTLDGGQTATITLDGKVINFVNYGAERRISDIIYFATAIPEQE